MYYGNIKNCDIANGEGVRVSLFVSGCTNHCAHCFQPETWNFDYGQPFTPETEAQIIKLLSPSYIAGLSLLGGEPFEPANQEALLPFLRRVREAYPGKTIWCYSGFTLDELRTEGSYPRRETTDDMLALLDVLVDGRFMEEYKDLALRFRGSRNQRLIDLNATRRAGQVVCLPDRRTNLS
ncbi:MAG: anaerobic ribonucleoside-triphosphate reductase activating protein [Oscillibacter sp.]|nr:anaerobic ribonucleoside-triphosphate reductase activating protein [Oscillibacter sp.]